LLKRVIVAQCFLVGKMELTRRMFWHLAFNPKSQRDGPMSAQAIGLGRGIATKQNPKGVALIREQTQWSEIELNHPDQ
jgi:hypothetical protein